MAQSLGFHRVVNHFLDCIRSTQMLSWLAGALVGSYGKGSEPECV